MSPNSNNDDLSNSQNEENALWAIVGYLLWIINLGGNWLGF